MPRISVDNYDTVASWNGSQDLFVVEQPDGTKVATPAQIKQYVLGNSIDDIYSVMGQMGAKNLFNSQYSVPRTNAGTTATLGDDGHVILNGTANADAAQLTRPGTTIKPIKDLKVGDKLILSYKVISGTFTHGSSSNTTTLYFNNRNGSAVDPIKFPSSLSAGDSDSKEITLTDVCFTDGILDLKDIQIYMRNGDTFNNLELAIMLRLASDTDNTYEPYAMTNKQLTDQLETKQDTLTFDNVPTQNSNNPVKSGGIFSTMAVPKYDSANRREYYEGGAAFDGNIDSVPTAGSNNAVASGGTKTYVDNAVAAKADTYISSSRDAAQSFNVGTATSNRMFLLATGYASSYQFGIVFVNYNGSSISYKSIASATLTVDAITYDNGIISVTFSSTPYTNARLIRLC